MRDYESTLKQARTCANRKYCDIGGNCEYYDAGVCCQGGEKDILNDAADAIEELVAAVPKWISVEERLPETISAVLVYCPRNKCTYTAIWIGLKWLHFGGCRSDHVAFPVTHWMPLPSAPKEETE